MQVIDIYSELYAALLWTTELSHVPHACKVLTPHLYINLRRSHDCLRSFVRGGRQSGVPSFVTARVPSWRPPSDAFSSLWAAFTLTVHINALYNDSIHGKEEHAT